MGEGEGGRVKGNEGRVKGEESGEIPVGKIWNVSFAYHDGIAVPPPEPSVGKFSKHRWHKMAIYVKARE